MKQNALIVYFSATGNTKKAAEAIQKYTNADIFRLKATHPYEIHGMQWNDRIDIEGKTNAYPSIANKISNWDDYSLIYLGSPIWFWGEPSRIMATFFKEYDFKNKIVAPFYTSMETPVEKAMQGFKKIAKPAHAKLLNGFQYTGNNLYLHKWLKYIHS
ncbi:flavodoxin [uncultured Lactobacillus sp.]|uniref:flavodoxin n=1 Tax=uncultured Lactobacillus sp. TaxID=153152 RepID=UPI002805DBE7|nr:flavodoxin [uncultured Lactobacillus sp.]